MLLKGKFDYQEDIRLLKRVRVPTWEQVNAGNHWMGINHYDIASVIAKEFHRRNIEIYKLRFHVTRNDQDMVLSLQVADPALARIPILVDTIVGSKTYTALPSFGLYTSNSRRKLISFYSGYHCATTGVAGEFGMATSKWKGRRYTFKFDLEKEVRDAIDEWYSRTDHARSVLLSFKSHRLRFTMANNILVQCGMLGLLPWNQVGTLIRVYKGHCDESIMTMYLKFCRKIAKKVPTRHFQLSWDFQKIIREVCPEVCNDQQDANGFGIVNF